jgi:metabotropic X receptor
MHQELCKGQPGLCEEMKPTKGSELLRYLKNVKFKGLTGDEFNFDSNGDGPARYNIIHFKQGKLFISIKLYDNLNKYLFKHSLFQNLVQPGKYQWIKIGEYNNGGK